MAKPNQTEILYSGGGVVQLGLQVRLILIGQSRVRTPSKISDLL